MAHLHLFVRARGIKKPLLTPDRASIFIERAVAAAGMKIIEGPHSKLGIVPGNEGVSSTAILDFSSVNLHEWPDLGLIHFDLYTCGKAPEIARFRALIGELEPDDYVACVVDRDQLFDRIAVTERAKLAAAAKPAPRKRRRRTTKAKEHA